MALTLNLYVINKRTNSTATPSGDGTVYTGEYIENTDILNPSIRLITPAATFDPTGFNYARLRTRYYWINSWTYTPEGWIADMSVDVLATYKTQIGNTSFYLLRSSYAKDGNIIDNFYPTKTDASVSSTWATTQPWLASIETGVYIIGVLSPSPQFGSISYYAMPASSLTVLCNYLLHDAVTTGNNFNVSDASLALQKSLIDPFQYIKSCVFLPITYSVTPGAAEQTSFPIWDWTVLSCPCKKLLTTAPYFSDARQFNMPKHPQTTDRGNYMNTSPFTVAELYFPPFGTIRLDTATTCSYPYLYMAYRIDLATGIGTLWVWATKTGFNSDKVLIANVETQVGVPIQLSQVTRDYAGMVGGFVGSAASLLAGDFVGGLGGLIGSAAKGIYPHTSTIGSGGTFYQLNFDASLNMTFFPAIEDDNAHFGRPLCGAGLPKDYPGYLLIEHADMAISGALATELDQIKQFLESGFFYE